MIEKHKDIFKAHVRKLQDQISDTLKEIDPELKLTEDNWDRLDFVGRPGGGGRTRAFIGSIIENAGVNTSCVFGEVDPDFAKRIGGTNNQMWACGISLIIHPRNPKVPTVHANFRMIHAGEKFWFGGGADLTPYYPHIEDFKHFHKIWKNSCDKYGVYEDFRNQCDKYFVNHHRNNEMRGISGIFFDHFNTGNIEEDMNMSIDLSNQFIKSYFPILEKRKDEEFSAEDEDFQLHRRGRYVEFNLLHDRGTHFGLKSNGRVESILISLPGRVKYSYNYRPGIGSAHEEMLKYYQADQLSKLV